MELGKALATGVAEERADDEAVVAEVVDAGEEAVEAEAEADEEVSVG